jgi:anti-sigma B factor antagonist
MDIPLDTIADVAVAVLPVEELDAGNAEEVKRAVAPVLQAHTKVVFDLSRLRFMDSSGVGFLLCCLQKLNAAGGNLKLCGLSQQVRMILELVRLHRLLDIHGTREESVAAFGKAGPARWHGTPSSWSSV